MTETMQNPVHISDNNINFAHCMARKANLEQCSRRKKNGDYCGLHTGKNNILRIDEDPPIKKKTIRKKTINKTKIINVPEFVDIAARNIEKVEKIQKFYRKLRKSKFDRLRGPALHDHSLCNNKEDLYLLDDLTHINDDDFFSIKDQDGFIYGFHIETIHNYIDINKDKSEIVNPYNNNPIPQHIIENIRTLYNFCHKKGFVNKIELYSPTEEHLILRNKVMNVFQKIDELKNYTDIDWFLKLDHNKMIKLLFSVKDLFLYRMQLTDAKKKEIKKNGTIFKEKDKYYRTLPFIKLQNIIINEFDDLVSQGKTHDDRYLGSLVILTALVEINSKCAQAYPWLVQGSFMI